MSKPPSDATLLRTCKSDLRTSREATRVTQQERDHYRARATKAEQECAEWKRRFDLLLARDQATPTDFICNCHTHKHGETTGGWYCPAHGHQL